jgi:hypothetical protein
MSIIPCINLSIGASRNNKIRMVEPQKFKQHEKSLQTRKIIDTFRIFQCLAKRCKQVKGHGALLKNMVFFYWKI